MKWRLIVDKAQDAFTNMAIDNALLLEGKIPTLRYNRKYYGSRYKNSSARKRYTAAVV